jgi:hypothetical protein
MSTERPAKMPKRTFNGGDESGHKPKGPNEHEDLVAAMVPKRLAFCHRLLTTVFSRAASLPVQNMPITWRDAKQCLLKVGVHGPFVQYLVGRYLRLSRCVCDEQPYLGPGTYQTVWYLLGAAGAKQVPQSYAAPLLEGLSRSLLDLVMLHCPELSFLVDLATAEHLLCEFAKYKFRTGISRTFTPSCPREYWQLLELFLKGSGVKDPPTFRKVEGVPVVHEFWVAGNPINTRALAEVVNFFEACLVSFLRRRLGWSAACVPIRDGADVILKDPRFQSARRLEWCWQLDRGSLVNYRYVIWPLCKRVDPTMHAEDWVNLVAAVTICACAPARWRLGWITKKMLTNQQPNLCQLLAGVQVRWPYGRAIDFKIR